MGKSPSKPYIIYGIHAVKAALFNKNRSCHELFVTRDALESLQGAHKKKPDCPITFLSRKEIAEKVGGETVHQGCALSVSPLETVHVEDILSTLHADPCPDQLIMVLDQVTDPHNVGAILRSCAAFGANALILPERHAPGEENAILTKIACGAVEHVPLVSVTNLSRTLETLKAHEFWCVGLDERGEKSLNQLDPSGKHVLVMGAEGEGLRRLTREACDFLVKLPTTPSFPTLNVSNAAAVSLYHFSRIA